MIFFQIETYSFFAKYSSTPFFGCLFLEAIIHIFVGPFQFYFFPSRKGVGGGFLSHEMFLGTWWIILKVLV